MVLSSFRKSFKNHTGRTGLGSTKGFSTGKEEVLGCETRIIFSSGVSHVTQTTQTACCCTQMMEAVFQAYYIIYIKSILRCLISLSQKCAHQLWIYFIMKVNWTVYAILIWVE